MSVVESEAKLANPLGNFSGFESAVRSFLASLRKVSPAPKFHLYGHPPEIQILQQPMDSNDRWMFELAAKLKLTDKLCDRDLIGEEFRAEKL